MVESGYVYTAPNPVFEFVRDTLHRLQPGRPPIADLFGNAAAVTLVEAAYRMPRHDWAE